MDQNPVTPRDDDSTDPGWGTVVRTMLLNSVLFWRRPDPSAHDGVTILRFLFASLLVAGPLITFVTSFIVDGFGPVDSGLVALCIGLALASSLVGTLVMRRKIRTGTEEEFVSWYRTTFFMAFASVEAPYLVTFVIAMTQDRLLPVVIGLLGFIVGMLRIAPGRANIAKLQQRVTAEGSSLEVLGALKRARPPADPKRS